MKHDTNSQFPRHKIELRLCHDTACRIALRPNRLPPTALLLPFTCRRGGTRPARRDGLVINPTQDGLR